MKPVDRTRKMVEELDRYAATIEDVVTGVADGSDGTSTFSSNSEAYFHRGYLVGAMLGASTVRMVATIDVRNIEAAASSGEPDESAVRAAGSDGSIHVANGLLMMLRRATVSVEHRSSDDGLPAIIESIGETAGLNEVIRRSCEIVKQSITELLSSVSRPADAEMTDSDIAAQAHTAAAFRAKVRVLRASGQIN